MFWKGISQWCSFIILNVAMVREPEKCLFWQYPSNEGHNFLLMTYLPTDSKLEGLKNLNATLSLLCKLDFVIHSVRSIL